MPIIPRSGHLSEIELAAEDEFASAIEADVERYLAEYESRFGKIINTDSAKLLYAPYANDPELRVKFSRAAYGPAKWLMNQLFDRRIRSDEIEFVIFMAGGTASGKSSCAELIGDDLARADLIVDGTLSNAKLAEAQIGLGLEQGKIVQVTYVFCEVKEALKRAITRSLKINRTLSLNVFAGSHFHCRETVEGLFTVFQNYREFKIKVIDNCISPTLISQEGVLPFFEQLEKRDLETTSLRVYDWFDEVCKNYERETGTSIPANIREAFLVKGREVSKT